MFRLGAIATGSQRIRHIIFPLRKNWLDRYLEVEPRRVGIALAEDSAPWGRALC
jgi:hypothetical protein